MRCSSEMPFFPGAQRAIDYVRSGALGRIVEARNSFLHSSDLDTHKPLNWKRQNRFCGEAGVLNDLGHAHLARAPAARLGARVGLRRAAEHRHRTPRPDGEPVPCDTWDNATIHSWVGDDGERFPLTTETKRIDPGQKNTWSFEAIGLDGGVRFSTKNPKLVEVFGVDDIPGIGREQVWQQIDAGSQSVWPTVTGGELRVRLLRLDPADVGGVPRRARRRPRRPVRHGLA